MGSAAPSPDGTGSRAGAPGRGAGVPARQIELVFERLDALPTLSPIAVRLLSVVSSDDAQIDEVVRLIESDPALTVRILGLVRRASHGLGDRIATVRHATTMLGLEAVQSAVLGISVYELFHNAGEEQDRALASGKALGGLADAPALDRVRLWTHLLGTACAAESLARHNPRAGVKPAEAFVAGLLHDVGKLALDLCLPASYARVVALAERRRCASAEAERSVIGLDHHTVGKRLAERWGLPAMLRDVIWLHSRPLASLPPESPRAMLGIVAAARAMCRELHVGNAYDFGRSCPPARACEEAGLDAGAVPRVQADLHEELAARAAALGLNVPTSREAMLASIAQANRKLGALNGALDERARQADALKRALAMVADFNRAARAGGGARSLTETLSLVARSALSIGGEHRPFVAIVVQDEPGAAWQGYRFDGAGRASVVGEIDSPREHDGSPRSLSELLGSPGADARMLGLLPWLTDCMSGAEDLLRVRAVPLCLGHGGASEPAAVLLTDLDAPRAGLGADAFDTLVACWGGAIASTAAVEHAARMGERLAESARELADAQARLTEAEALSRLGEMAAGAAHEMNNPLTVIRARAQMLLRRLTSSQDRGAAEAIAESASRISDLITSMHLLASPPELSEGMVRPREVAEHAMRKAVQRTGLEVAVRLDVPEYLPAMRADRELLSLALAELIGNAMQSGPDPKVRVHAQIDPVDDRLCVSVEDHGVGMSEHTLQHAFDPFFSDQPAGRRRGMGLARARSIVTAHGGEVALESTPGAGTRALIVLPRWRGDAAMGAAA